MENKQSNQSQEITDLKKEIQELKNWIYTLVTVTQKEEIREIIEKSKENIKKDVQQNALELAKCLHNCEFKREI
jgi:hypothetical protein